MQAEERHNVWLYYTTASPQCSSFSSPALAWLAKSQAEERHKTTLKTIPSATATLTTSNIARGWGVSTWPEAVRTWPEAVRTWPKAVHILVVGRLGR